MQTPSVGKKTYRTTRILYIMRLVYKYEIILPINKNFRASKSGPADSWPSTDEDDDEELDLGPKVIISSLRDESTGDMFSCTDICNLYLYLIT